MRKDILPNYVIYDFKSSFFMKLARIFPLHLHSYIVNRNLQKKVTLPMKMNDYKLLKDFQEDKPYPFKIGLYEKRGKKYVAKVWEGKFKNLHYYNLINEIVATYTLSLLRGRLEKKLDSEMKKVFTPRYVEVIREKNKLIFISEYMEGIIFKNLSENGKKIIYLKIKKYLKFLGDNLRPEEKELLRIKDARNILFQFPIIFSASILRRPYLIIDLIKSLYIFMETLPTLFKGRSFSIVHGDINFDNILISKNKISIIDIEQLMYTFEEYEDITTLSTARNTSAFSTWIVKKLLEKSMDDKRLGRMISLLILNCEIHNFTGNTSEISYKRHLKMMRIAFYIYNNIMLGKGDVNLSEIFNKGELKS